MVTHINTYWSNYQGISLQWTSLQWTRTTLTLFSCVISLFITTTYAQPLNLSHVKITENLQPNILIMVDDSISIDWEIMTSGQWTLGGYLPGLPKYIMSGDGIYNSAIKTKACDPQSYAYLWKSKDNSWNNKCNGGSLFSSPEVVDADWRLLSNEFNKIYYNPTVTYKPWPGYPDADFTKARSHPDPSQKGYKQIRNLGTSDMRFATWHDTAGFSGSTPSPNSATQTPNGIIDLWDNFTSYEISNSSILVKSYEFKPKANATCNMDLGQTLKNYTRCFNGTLKIEAWNTPFGRNLQQEQLNIANWYQYHRRRSFALRNLVAILVEQFPDFRYGLDFTTNYNNTFIEIPNSKANIATHNKNLIRDMFEYTQKSASTPLATALDRTGQYFEGKLKGKPSPISQSCQANYTLMLTDGFWNDKDNYRGQARGDLDKDGAKNGKINTTLADIAHYYFNKDLAPSINNDFSLMRTRCKSVPVPTHQHMSTIGVTFGPFGNLKADSDGCWPTPVLKSNDNWGNPLGNSTEDLLARIDDLWHAAYNSNGFFTSSSDPKVLLDELSEIFSSISQLNASGARGTLASSRLDTKNALIITKYDVANNTGTLESYPSLPSSGNIQETPRWSTDNLKGNNRFETGKRNLFSLNTKNNKGIRLTGANSAAEFSSEQRAALYPRDTVPTQLSNTQTWLNELTTAPMGATVHSNPTFVGQPSRTKSFQSEEVKQGYSDFQIDQENKLKRDMIYIGSNRGLLHGIDMDTGKEVFSYLPDALINANLPQTNTGYTSKVDGQITAEDVFFTSQNQWRTVIVGGFRFGATGYFALDVTNPDQFTSNKGSDAILWEYSNQGTGTTNNPNLGYSYSKAAIGRMANGKWVAAFGNGYNSENGQASIIILDIESGKLIHELQTGKGPAQDPLNLQRSNGMAEPALVDQDQDGIVDFIYAGDFFGNLYAFDVQAKSPQQWSSRYGSSTNATPLYSTNGAPITSRPAVMRTANKQSVMVIVGTGQNITTSSDNTPTNSLFGVIDQGQAINSSSQLKTIQLSTSQTGWSLKSPEATTTTTDLGWHLQLSGQAQGYQITTQPLIELGELTVLLTKSSEQVCGPSSASSVLLKMNPLTGSSLNRTLFMDNSNSGQAVDTQIDGIVLEDTLLNDLSLATTGTQGIIISNSANGKIIQIETTYPPQTEGRQRFRRLYD